jgi:hypothetical protein
MSEPRRLVNIQFQRYRPQTVTLVVSLPEDWTDEQIKASLSEIYEEVDCASHDWVDQDDWDPDEGDHELAGEAEPMARPDLVFPVEDDDE